MTRAEKNIRDEALIQRYLAGEKPTVLAAEYELTVSAVFAIFKRWGVKVRSGRRAAWDTKRYDRDVPKLINTGFCNKADKADLFLKTADYLQQNPHQFELHKIGLTVNKLKMVNETLMQVKAHVNYAPPFFVHFTSKNVILPLNYRQLLLLAAQPFAHIMERQKDIISLAEAVTKNI